MILVSRILFESNSFLNVQILMKRKRKIPEQVTVRGAVMSDDRCVF